MVAPPTTLRNAEGAQSEGRVGGGRPSTPVQRGQQYKHYRGRSPCVQMYGAPATSAGTPRRLRAQEPRPGPLYSDTTATDSAIVGNMPHLFRTVPLREMLATKGPGHPEGHPGPVQWLRPPGNPAQAPRVLHVQGRPYLAGRADTHRPP